MSDKLTINLQIGGTNFPLLIERADERLYRNAAEWINKRLNLYRQKFTQEGYDKVLAMVTLHFAFEYAKAVDRNDTEPFCKKIKELDRLLDEVESGE